jgi:ribonuclease HI
MPWAWSLLRGTRVLARAAADGSLVKESDGRVEIRYGLGHPKAYRAAARNLEPVGEPLVADEAFGGVEPIEPKPRAAAKASGKPQISPSTYEGWIAYTDGACSTNNVGELTAILRAVEWAPAHGPLLVYTDSQYAIGVLQKGWKAKANPELIAHTKRLIAERGQVRLEYVRGHAGHELNEKADELARKAVSSRASKRAELPSA